MRPLLRSGDWIGVRWCERPSESATTGSAVEPAFGPGDVLLGRGPDEVWLVHRLVRREEGGRYVLKGDASSQTEDLGGEGIWGRVVAIRPAWSGDSRALETTWLDRWIARLSRHRLRRAVYVLGWLRRAAL